MLRLSSLIFRNIGRNRRRSLLTLVSLAISLCLLGLIVALFQGFFYADDVSPASARRLICRHKVSLAQPMPISHIDKIRAVPGVEQVAPYVWFQGKYKDDRFSFARFATDANVIFEIMQDYTIPPDQLEAFRKQRTSCVVGEKIARDYNIKIGDRVTIQGDIYPVDPELEVVGIFKHPLQGESLIFHREYLSELLGADSPQRDLVGAFLILADSPGSVGRIADRIDNELFANSPYPTRTESEKQFQLSFLAFLGNIKLFLGAICAAVTFTIILVSANTVAMSVRERTREMAILRTLGYTPGEIMQLILGEAVVLSLAGGLVGLGMGLTLRRVLMIVSRESIVLPPIHWQAAAIVFAVACVVGFVSSLIPAAVASRKNLIESLRFAG